MVQAQLSPSHNSYTVFGVPGVTYYITVFAVNALGPGPIYNDSIATGNAACNFYYSSSSPFPSM